MAPPPAISWGWHDHGRLGVKLEITHHDSGNGPVFRVQFSDGEQLTWVGSESAAKAAAAVWFRDQGHTSCSARCVEWTAIPQPAALTESQKRDAVACFLALDEAVRAGGSHENYLNLDALQRAYRGDSRALVDGFGAATDKHRALQQLETALREEIEAYIWQQARE